MTDRNRSGHDRNQRNMDYIWRRIETSDHAVDRYQRALEVQISLNRLYRERIDALERRISRLEDRDQIRSQADEFAR